MITEVRPIDGKEITGRIGERVEVTLEEYDLEAITGNLRRMINEDRVDPEGPMSDKCVGIVHRNYPAVRVSDNVFRVQLPDGVKDFPKYR